MLHAINAFETNSPGLIDNVLPSRKEIDVYFDGRSVSITLLRSRVAAGVQIE
jgi:hypothetical protein